MLKYFFSGGGSIEVFFGGEGGIKLFFFEGITWFSGQTESVVADRVLNWGDYIKIECHDTFHHGSFATR